MTLFRLSVSGPVDPDIVWERYALPALWATWSPQIRGVECSAARIAPGATGRVHGPAGVGVDFVVDAVDEAARTWTWTVYAGPLLLRLDHGVTPRHPRAGTTTPRPCGTTTLRPCGTTTPRPSGTTTPRPSGTTTSLTVHGPAPVALAYLPVARVALTRLVRRP